MLKVLEIISFVLVLFTEETTSSCYKPTLYASTSYKTYSVTSYSSKESYCTIKIRPSYLYAGNDNYYLKITWLSFNVKGYMPDCKDDYVLVYLTSSYKSIGKYCSNNLKSVGIFSMYSHDGYAKLKYKSAYGSVVFGRGFSFSYQLLPKDFRYLGSKYSTYCPVSYFSYMGTKYSQGWPASYADSPSACTQKQYIGSSYNARIAFMDIDTNSNGHSCGGSSSDYVQLQGANNSQSYNPTSISGRLCSSDHIKSYTITNYTYMYLKFNRPIGQEHYSFYRGYVAGYILYEPKTSKIPKNESPTYSPSINYGGIIAGALSFPLILLIMYLRRRCRSQAVMQNQANPTVQHVRTNTTAYETTVMSETLNVHPGTSPQSATSTYPPSYAAATSYPQAPSYSAAAIHTEKSNIVYPTSDAYPATTTYNMDPFNTQPIASGPSTTPAGLPRLYLVGQLGPASAANGPEQGPYPNQPPPAYSDIVSGP